MRWARPGWRICLSSVVGFCLGSYVKGNPLASVDPDGMQAIPLLPPPPVVTGAPGAVGAYNGGDLRNPNGNWDFGPMINSDSLRNALKAGEMLGVGPRYSESE